MKKKDFPITKAEAKLERVLLALAIILFIIIGLGIYFQNDEGNISQILAMLLFMDVGVFFILLGRNGLKKGNLIPKWMSFLFKDPKQIAQNRTEKDKTLIKNAGIVHIIAGILSFILAIMNL